MIYFSLILNALLFFYLTRRHRSGIEYQLNIFKYKTLDRTLKALVCAIIIFAIMCLVFEYIGYDASSTLGYVVNMLDNIEANLKIVVYLVVFIIVVIIRPFVEELIYRDFIYREIEHRRQNIKESVFLTALAATIINLLFISIDGFKIFKAEFLIVILAVFVMQLLLTTLRAWTRSVVASFIANMASALAMYIYVILYIEKLI